MRTWLLYSIGRVLAISILGLLLSSWSDIYNLHLVPLTFCVVSLMSAVLNFFFSSFPSSSHVTLQCARALTDQENPSSCRLSAVLLVSVPKPLISKHLSCLRQIPAIRLSSHPLAKDSWRAASLLGKGLCNNQLSQYSKTGHQNWAVDQNEHLLFLM